ncbi:hypothetical protein HOG48_02180, partial [Candidatus Peregrinibacteria bacterium]|nr:hypothetical protein [Candidatus Peregrinibacteria bacterium]
KEGKEFHYQLIEGDDEWHRGEFVNLTGTGRVLIDMGDLGRLVRHVNEFSRLSQNGPSDLARTLDRVLGGGVDHGDEVSSAVRARPIQPGAILKLPKELAVRVKGLEGQSNAEKLRSMQAGDRFEYTTKSYPGGSRIGVFSEQSEGGVHCRMRGWMPEQILNLETRHFTGVHPLEAPEDPNPEKGYRLAMKFRWSEDRAGWDRMYDHLESLQGTGRSDETYAVIESHTSGRRVVKLIEVDRRGGILKVQINEQDIWNIAVSETDMWVFEPDNGSKADTAGVAEVANISSGEAPKIPEPRQLMGSYYEELEELLRRQTLSVEQAFAEMDLGDELIFQRGGWGGGFERAILIDREGISATLHLAGEDFGTSERLFMYGMNKAMRVEKPEAPDPEPGFKLTKACSFKMSAAEYDDFYEYIKAIAGQPERKKYLVIQAPGYGREIVLLGDEFSEDRYKIPVHPMFANSVNARGVKIWLFEEEEQTAERSEAVLAAEEAVKLPNPERLAGTWDAKIEHILAGKRPPSEVFTKMIGGEEIYFRFKGEEGFQRAALVRVEGEKWAKTDDDDVILRREEMHPGAEERFQIGGFESVVSAAIPSASGQPKKEGYELVASCHLGTSSEEYLEFYKHLMKVEKEMRGLEAYMIIGRADRGVFLAKLAGPLEDDYEISVDLGDGKTTVINTNEWQVWLYDLKDRPNADAQERADDHDATEALAIPMPTLPQPRQLIAPWNTHDELKLQAVDEPSKIVFTEKMQPGDEFLCMRKSESGKIIRAVLLEVEAGRDRIVFCKEGWRAGSNVSKPIVDFQRVLPIGRPTPLPAVEGFELTVSS